MTSLQNKIAREEAQLSLEKKLLALYPDLVINKDRWGNIKLCSPSLNSKVDQVYFKATCGCCSDAPYQAVCYLEVEGARVYSNPPSVIFAQQVLDTGIEAPKDWETIFDKFGFNDEIKRQVAEYIKDNPSRNYDDE